MNEKYDKYINNIPDFPKEGVIFKDISPMLKEKMPELIEDFGSMLPIDEIEHFVGIESRGFILASALAAHYNKGFVMIRKKGKLPPPLVSESYALEYGEDTIEMQRNDQPHKIILIDDVLATGGTLKAAKKLCEQNNYEVKGMAILINLTFLNKLKESETIYSLLNY